MYLSGGSVSGRGPLGQAVLTESRACFPLTPSRPQFPLPHPINWNQNIDTHRALLHTQHHAATDERQLTVLPLRILIDELVFFPTPGQQPREKEEEKKKNPKTELTAPSLCLDQNRRPNLKRGPPPDLFPPIITPRPHIRRRISPSGAVFFHCSSGNRELCLV